MCWGCYSFYRGLSGYLFYRLFVCTPLTSSCLMVSNFAVCVIPFFAGFHPKDFILEMLSMRYVNMLGFFYYLCCGLNDLLFFPFVLFCFMW
jgi:hypothetical protein